MINKLIKQPITVGKIFFTVTVLSLLAFILHGYYFGVSDQEIFIPYILKSTDNQLFPGDLLFNQSSANASFFYSLIALLSKYLNLQTIFLMGYLMFQIIFFFSIYKLAYVLTKRRDLAIAALLPFLVPKFIGGTANYTYDTFFGYRSIGLVFLIFYLVYLFEKKYNKAAAIAAIGVWFHPLSIIPNIFLLPILVIMENKSHYRFIALLKSLFFFFMLVSPLILFSKVSGLSNFRNMFDADWLSIIKERDDYLFISTWSITGWAALGLYMVPIAMFLRKLEKPTQKTLRLIIITSFTVFLINAFALEILKIPAFAQFQLVRSITSLAYIGLILTVFLISSKYPWQFIFGTLAFVTLAANAFLLFMISIFVYAGSLILFRKSSAFSSGVSKAYILATLVLTLLVYALINNLNIPKMRNRIQYPKANSDWIDVQKWAKANTKQDDLFLVPPDQTGFRIFSQRPIVGDIKDGATVMYSPTYAINWYQTILDLTNYEKLSDNDFIELRRKYYFSYILTASEKNLRFELKYKNKRFNVYKI